MNETTYPRHPDWKARLDSHVRENLDGAFSWSDRNCATFARDWVLLATGRAIALPECGTSMGALSAVKAMGGLAAEATRRLGEPAPGLMAQAGDVVLLALPRARGRRYHSLAVCLGSAVAAQGHQGLIMVPITEAIAAWRV